MLSTYKQLLAYHSQSETVKTGNLTTYPNDQIAVFIKSSAEEDVLFLVNVRNVVVNYSPPADIQNKLWVDVFSNEPVSLAGEYTFDPYSYLILKNQ